MDDLTASQRAKLEKLAGLSDLELMGHLMLGEAGVDHRDVEKEMWRRQLTATYELTAALQRFTVSSDLASGRLVFLTWVLVALTGTLVVLTVALFFRHA